MNGGWLQRSWPGLCEICRGWSRQPFCSDCVAVFAGERPRCRRCAEALTLPPEPTRIDPLEPCPVCRHKPPLFSAARVAFDYVFPWDGLIQQLKFSGRTELAGPLGDALARAVQGDAAGAERGEPGRDGTIDLILPLPLSPARLAERGYNQSLLLAQVVSRRLGRPLDRDLLLRPIDAPHQAQLPREDRLRNLRGVFMVDPAARARLSGRRVALVDDVITTGSTAEEATQELLRAGAQDVVLWAVARTAAH